MRLGTRTSVRLGLLAAVLAFSTQLSNANTSTMLSDKELAINSRLIITAEVRSVVSAWDDSHTMIWTYVELQRDELLKGQLNDVRIVLKQPGGEVGGTGIQVFGQPLFAVGQQVLLYLNTAPDGSLHVAHAFMGLFSIVEDSTTGEVFATRSTDAAQARIIPRTDADAVTDRAPVKTYVKNLREILQRESTAIDDRELQSRQRPIVAIPAEYNHIISQPAGYSLNFALLGGGARWMQADSGQPIIYHLNPASSPVAGGGTAEILRAMDAWPNQSGANIRLQLGSQATGCGNHSDGVNTISFGDCFNELDPPVGCSGVLAQTSVSYVRDQRIIGGVAFNRIIEADVSFNSGFECFLGTSANLAEVACHELGHSIGLGHSADLNAIMWASAKGRGRDATLANDDRAGVNSIYPGSGSGGGGGGQTSDPFVRKVKIKRINKLVIIGDNFNQTSLLLLNNALLNPLSTSFDPESGRLIFVGNFALASSGSNSLVVVNGQTRSVPFRF